MIADIRGLLNARSFQAFCDETWVVISGMHISAIELGNPHAAA